MKPNNVNSRSKNVKSSNYFGFNVENNDKDPNLKLMIR